MCHGQVVSQKILVARKDHECSACGRPIPRKRRFWFGTSRSYEEGTLGNYKLCMRCARLQELIWEGGGSDSCVAGDPRDEFEQQAKDVGWRAFLAMLRGKRP